MGDFEVLIRDRCLHACGPLDASTAPVLLREIATAEGLIDRVDLSRITFIDSAGIQALLVHRRRYPGVDLRNLGPAVSQLVDLLGIRALICAPERVS